MATKDLISRGTRSVMTGPSAPHLTQPPRVFTRAQDVTATKGRLPPWSRGDKKPKTQRKKKGPPIRTAKPNANAPTNPMEAVRQMRRRMNKAEQDERMDIALTLTPVRTYMGGFTRPTDLRSSNWWLGGMYGAKQKRYENPPESAYQPHTVFLLESRYMVKGVVGIADKLDHIVGVCRAADLPAIIAKYNSDKAPSEAQEAMDNARWPWLKSPPVTKLSWCDNDPMEALEEDLGDISGLESLFPDAVAARLEAYKRYRLRKDTKAQTEAQTEGSSPKDNHTSHAVINPAVAETSSSNINYPSTRSIHTSARASTSGTSSHNDDDVVPIPDNYVKRKRRKAVLEAANVSSGPFTAQPNATIQRGAPKHGKVISNQILREDMHHSIHRFRNKDPAEIMNEDGELAHAPGFVVPTQGYSTVPISESGDRPVGLEKSNIAKRIRENERSNDTSFVDERSEGAQTHLSKGKPPSELTQEDGSVIHASGFEVPTAMDAFEHLESGDHDKQYSAAFLRSHCLRKMDDVNSVELIWDTPANVIEAKFRAGQANQNRSFSSSAINQTTPFTYEEGEDLMAILEEDLEDPDYPELMIENKRGSSLDTKLERLRPARAAHSAELQGMRARYLPTLTETPFYRPLLALTFPTRPIATTIGRLSRGRVRGLPFFASVVPDDRKYGVSFSSRMRCMRIDRMLQLTADIAGGLAGLRGGIPGIRFSPEDRGRGIHSEGMATPIPASKRRIVVSVGEWYYRADEVKDYIRKVGEQTIGRVGIGMGLGEDELPFDVYGMDDSGIRCNEDGASVPWPEPKQTPTLEELIKLVDEEQAPAAQEDSTSDAVLAEGDPQSVAQRHAIARAQKERRDQLATKYRRAIATTLAQNDRRVMKV